MLHELLPLDAEINGPLNELTVLFDGDLEPDLGLDLANWTLVFGDSAFSVTGAAADGREVKLTVADLFVPGAPNGVTFAPPPFDVRGTDGGFAAAFADFPVHL